jgi:hypothetical protein
MVSDESAASTHKTVLQMEREFVLAGTVHATLRTRNTKGTFLIVLMKLRLTREDAFAAPALEMIQSVVLLECCSIRAVENAARLQAVLVHLMRRK